MHGGHADGIAGRGGVWVLGVGSCNGMSRAKHRLGRRVTWSDRRDPQTMVLPLLLIRKKPIPGTIWADFAVPLRAEFPSDFGRVFCVGGLHEVNFSDP